MSSSSTPTPTPTPTSTSTSLLRPSRILAACLLVPFLAAGWIALRSYQREAGFYDPLGRTISLDEAASLPGAQEVAFESTTGSVAGWYVPSTTGAAVVLAHGSLGDRRSMVPEAELLVGEGHGVLLLDMPGHGESEGDVDWSSGGRAAIEEALDLLETRPDVDPDRLGAVGTSMGGFTIAQVAASDERLKAVALLGAPHDQDEVTRWENRRFGPLSEVPALWAMERGGLPRDELVPIEEIGKIAPRAVLVVGGTEDDLVTPAFTERFFDAAGEPRELLLVEGAGHAAYFVEGDTSFPDALQRFFGEHLLDGR